ncbi:hypothetical protein [Parasulfitobacter algicola]|uniref:Uncharacterized protein n=1 Tax=Parasulfitobacter algicola TaxID=2614809 RepID=A0ABX2IZJ8_9RHOB|nr:hypothetical protein [Sulfitobacter algicola]NSX56692.1 hypothetical protein [Sulfitobacter algicola]
MSLSRSITQILDQVRKTATLREDEGRVLPAFDPDERLKAITTEIGETLLPRALCFQIGENSQLFIDAGSRRLLKVIDLNPQVFLREGDTLFSGRDDSHHDEQLESLAHMLSLFAHQDGELKVFSTPPQDLYGADEVGYTSDEIEKICAKLDISSEDIERALSQAAASVTERPDTEPKKEQPASGNAPEDIRSFFKTVCQFGHSCLLISPQKQLVDQKQDPQNIQLDALTQEIGFMLEKWLTDTSSVMSGQRLIVMRSQAADGASVAFFMNAGFSVVAHFNNKDLGRALAAWNSVTD